MRRSVREGLNTALLAVLMLFVLQFTAQNFRVVGSSMEPTISTGERFIVNRLIYYSLDIDRLNRYLPFVAVGAGGIKYLFHPPVHGDIVVFNYPKDPVQNFVKRVVAVPGDTIGVVGGGVYVNGQLTEESYVLEWQHANMEKILLADDEYFVLGDNRRYSNDSQDWGPVPMKNIVGKAWLAYWPMSKLGFF
jgi:signal peptidase I